VIILTQHSSGVDRDNWEPKFSGKGSNVEESVGDDERKEKDNDVG
jgi:hypothetical protein